MQEHNGNNGGNKERTAIHMRFVMGEKNAKCFGWVIKGEELSMKL